MRLEEKENLEVELSNGWKKFAISSLTPVTAQKNNDTKVEGKGLPKLQLLKMVKCHAKSVGPADHQQWISNLNEFLQKIPDLYFTALQTRLLNNVNKLLQM